MPLRACHDSVALESENMPHCDTYSLVLANGLGEHGGPKVGTEKMRLSNVFLSKSHRSLGSSAFCNASQDQQFGCPPPKICFAPYPLSSHASQTLRGGERSRYPSLVYTYLSLSSSQLASSPMHNIDDRTLTVGVSILLSTNYPALSILRNGSYGTTRYSSCLKAVSFTVERIHHAELALHADLRQAPPRWLSVLHF